MWDQQTSASHSPDEPLQAARGFHGCCYPWPPPTMFPFLQAGVLPLLEPQRSLLLRVPSLSSEADCPIAEKVTFFQRCWEDFSLRFSLKILSFTLS